MSVTNYYTIDGQMIGYKDANGRKDFLTDNLGSVTAEIDQTGTNRTFDGRYRPYGQSLWSTGPRGSFGWVGTWGYRGTTLGASSHYVRARHYSEVSASWTSNDPIWPREAAYVYVNSRPTDFADMSGKACWIQEGGEGVIYSHAYICFGTPCGGSYPNGGGVTSCGFWPGSSPSQPGVPYAGATSCAVGGSSSAGGSSMAGGAGWTGGGLIGGIILIVLGGVSSVGGWNGGFGAEGGHLECPDRNEHGKCANPLPSEKHACNNDPKFDAALCQCVRNSMANPPRFCAGRYVCGSWVSEMWECAKKTLGLK